MNIMRLRNSLSLPTASRQLLKKTKTSTSLSLSQYQNCELVVSKNSAPSIPYFNFVRDIKFQEKDKYFSPIYDGYYKRGGVEHFVAFMLFTPKTATMPTIQ